MVRNGFRWKNLNIQKQFLDPKNVKVKKNVCFTRVFLQQNSPPAKTTLNLEIKLVNVMAYALLDVNVESLRISGNQ